MSFLKRWRHRLESSELLWNIQLRRSRFHTWKTGHFEGWRYGVACWVIVASVVLVTNTILGIVIATTRPRRDGVHIIYEGSCSVVHRSSVALHLVINILSTLLLAASNYTMQCLASPTPEEIEVAHRADLWLDIGVPSFRNVFGGISGRRVLAWVVLAISSLPIYCLYNSVVFKTGTASLIDVALASQEFVDRLPLDDYSHLSYSDSDWSLSVELTSLNLSRAHPSGWSNLVHGLKTKDAGVRNISNEECISTYGRRFNAGAGPLLMIANDPPDQPNTGVFVEISTPEQQNSGWFSINAASTPYGWICGPQAWSGCDMRHLRKNSADWKMAINGTEFRIDYCIAMGVPEQCKLETSLCLLCTVILCNLLKVAAMLWALLCNDGHALVTVGDAIAHFMAQPVDAHPVVLTRSKGYSTWSRAASKRRWLFVLACGICSLVAACSLIWCGERALKRIMGGYVPLSLSFGSTIPNSFLRFDKPKGQIGLLLMILLVNCPQVVFTSLYFLYNGLVSSMLQAREWNSYYLRKRGLRVSKPVGQQRSTYFISLPYRYGLPLMIGSGTMHWLISQSIFLGRLDFVTYAASNITMHENAAIEAPGYIFTQYKSEAAYSTLPMLFVVVLGAVMIGCLVALGFRRLDGCMPIVGSNSLAIANACQRPDDDEEAAYKEVSWGELEHNEYGKCHCCFTSESTVPPCGPRVEEWSIMMHALRVEDEDSQVVSDEGSPSHVSAER